MPDWWELPHGREFVRAAAQHLRNGNNLIVRVPPGFARGWWASLGRMADEEDLLLDPLVLRDDGASDPLRLIAARFVPGEQSISAVWELAECERWSGIACIEFTKPPPMQWAAFLEAFRKACRGRSRGSGLLCILLEGAATQFLPPPREVGLEVLSFDGVLRLIDMRCYAAGLLLSTVYPSELEYALHVETVAQLAGFDPLLAEQLVSQSLPQLLLPRDLLIRYGQDKGWEEQREPCWVNGSKGLLEGRQWVHSAWIALHCADDPTQILRRLWRAQISVLWPWLEDCRNDWIEALSPDLQARAPAVSPNGSPPPESLNEWELKHLQDYLSSRRSNVHPRALDLLRKLVRLRNRLAHFGPELPVNEPETLHSPPLSAYAEILEKSRQPRAAFTNSPVRPT